jgi:hypothetical protein
MTQPSSEYPTELERRTKDYLELLRRIDAILADPVKTLIRITDEYIKETEQPNSKPTGFPVWMSDYLQPEPEDDLFSKAICFATLQEIWKLRRRFSWLPPKPDSERLERLLKSNEGTPNRLIKNLFPQKDDFSECVKSLSSRSFGALNPFTTSQVFQVLLRDSERQAHGALGFLAFFAMIWPLYRRFPDPQQFGAAIEPWEPKAFVTAKCILPIKTLQDFCTERADLMNKIVDVLERLKESADKDKEEYDPHQRWLFNVELDNLRARLLRLSSIVVAREKLKNRSNQVREFSDGLSQNSRSSLLTSYNDILERAADAIKDIGNGGVEVFKNARDVLNEIDEKIIKNLENPTEGNLEYLTGPKLKPGLKFAREYTEHPNKDVRTKYLKDLYTAAQRSLDFCSEALGILHSKYSLCKEVKSNLKSIKDIASQLATANKQVAEMMNDLVRNATIWCRAVADREIAYASAQNLTDFDPSELVSAIAVAVKWNQMTTTLQVSDAVGKALAGMRADGSWSAGQPFYSPNNALGVWPITSDIVLTLTEILEEHREVDIADAALFRYVDWLERTRTELNFPSDKKYKKTDELAVGWASDRFRHRSKIHFPTTAFSVNTLLKIRDLVEYRLWQLCENRFTIIRSHERSELKEVAPVDLGAQHKYRLHRRIAERQSGYEDAEYSFVLHGPPGSSKTSIAEALSVEQWRATRPWGSKEAPRLVRITPADFTRMGEDRLDSEARLIFDLLSGVRGVTILFDEIDDLLRQRNTGTGPLASKPTFMELVVPAMLNRLADLRDACPRQELCFVLATNFIESIEPALLRKGRIDRLLPVVYPDQESRLALIFKFTSELITAIEGKLKFDKTEISGCISNWAKELSGWPYQSIKAACRQVERDLNNALTQMSSEAGIGLSPEERRKRFRSLAKGSISKVINEYGSSISSPRYEERLVPPARQELLNEYAHFIISGCENGKDLENWFNGHYAGKEFKKRLSEAEHDQAINKLKKAQPVYRKIKAVLEDENRWPEDTTIRGMLGEAANLKL